MRPTAEIPKQRCEGICPVPLHQGYDRRLCRLSGYLGAIVDVDHNAAHRLKAGKRYVMPTTMQTIQAMAVYNGVFHFVTSTSHRFERNIWY